MMVGYLDKLDSILKKLFPILILILCVTIPVVKGIPGIIHIICVILFLVHLICHKGYLYQAKHYYFVGFFYLAVVAVSLSYTSEFVEGCRILKQQCVLLFGFIIIERLSTVEVCRRCLYAFALGGTILALLGAYQGLFLGMVRPPSLHHPVDGGNLLMVSAVVIVALLLEEKNIYIRLINAIMLAVHGIAFYFNGSRGVWIALIVILIMVPFLYRELSLKAKLIYLLLLPIVSINIANGDVFKARLLEAKNDLVAYKSLKSDTSVGARLEMWKASFQMIREHPVLGVGIGDWSYEVKEMIKDREVSEYIGIFKTAHNLYLDAMSTRGLAGLFSLILLIGSPVFFAYRRREPEYALFRNVVILLAVSVLVSGLSEAPVRLRLTFMSYVVVTSIGLAVLFRFPANRKITQYRNEE